MAGPDAAAGLTYRSARPGDALAIAGLHADSWRRHYRGAYSDAFLDDEAASFLGDMWTGRFAAPDPQARTVLAERDGTVVGLAHTILGSHLTWGALLDNLHVSYGMKRQGVGTRLLALSARAVLEAVPSSGLYLWVLEQNAAARAFYEARGGSCVDHRPVGAPGGDAARLNGRPVGLMMAWPDPSRLVLVGGVHAEQAGGLRPVLVQPVEDGSVADEACEQPDRVHPEQAAVAGYHRHVAAARRGDDGRDVRDVRRYSPPRQQPGRDPSQDEAEQGRANVRHDDHAHSLPPVTGE
jgi:ribosomal protein S18 acetylase RimI-like enzyme